MNTSKPLRTALWTLLLSFGLLVLAAAPHPDLSNAITSFRQSFKKTTPRPSRRISDFRNPIAAADGTRPAGSQKAGEGPFDSQTRHRQQPAESQQVARADSKPNRAGISRQPRTPRTTPGDATANRRRQSVFVVSETTGPTLTGPRVELGSIEDADDHPRVAGRAKATRLGGNPRSRITGIRSTSNTFEALPPSGASADPHNNAQLIALERVIQRLAQAQTDQQLKDLQRATERLEQVQQENRLRELERRLEQLQSGGSSTAATLLDGPATSTTGTTSSQAVMKASPTAGALDERFSLQIQDADITEVMEMLAQMAGMNILIGKDVSGTIPSANLKDVTIEQALDGILRSMGLAYEQGERIIYVMTEEDHEARRNLSRKLISKIYRPSYISVVDLQTLVAPLLTEVVGKTAVTNPSETGLATDAENAGGDRLAQSDAILVMDYPEVIAEVDALIEEMDVPPLQVVIEVMILSVRLNDNLRFGVNFALLNGNGNHLLVSGNGRTLNSSSGIPGVSDDTILPPVGDFLANAAGLKFGFIRGDISAFIDALENIADTNLIASPQLRVLNKQKANLIIGERLSYTTTTFNNTQSIQNVNFIDAGTKLNIRPFISDDGIVRMEVHPERSSATINTQTGLPDLQTTEVTTNVMVRDGTTVVIGGLIEEQVQESFDRIPFLGAIPWIGTAFRNKSESISRSELIVLITPRIVREPDDAFEGDVTRHENSRRAAHFRDNLAPINRRNLARMEYERARYYFDRGRFLKARTHVKRSLAHNKNDLKALRLEDEISRAIGETKRKWFGLSLPAVLPGMPDLSQETTDDESVREESLPPVPGSGESLRP